MGIDIHMLNFLKFARRKQAFGRVATIGRQEINVPMDKLKSALNLKGYTKYGPYCEELLVGHFAATVVESFDNSDYEHATHVVVGEREILVSGQKATRRRARKCDIINPDVRASEDQKNRSIQSR